MYVENKEEVLDKVLAQLERKTGVSPIRLPCGCFLARCLCCGRHSLIVGWEKGCAFGDPRDSRHQRWMHLLGGERPKMVNTQTGKRPSP